MIFKTVQSNTPGLTCSMVVFQITFRQSQRWSLIRGAQCVENEREISLSTDRYGSQKSICPKFSVVLKQV